MNSGLRTLLRALKAQTTANGKKPSPVPVEQVLSYGELLFPDAQHSLRQALQKYSLLPESAPLQRPPSVPPHGKRKTTEKDRRQRYGDPTASSPGWSDALALLELAKLSTASASHTTSTPPETIEKVVAESLLHVGRFPHNAQAAAMVARVLDRWRCLSGRATGKKSYSFPSSLSAEASCRLAYQLSQCDPATRPQLWAEALALYHHIAQQHTRTTADSSREVAAVPTATAREMASARHTVLVTLLRSGEWGRAMSFFRHSLYQHDMPDSVSTGFLMQSLGRAGRIEDVWQLYTVCVKLLRAETHRLRMRDSPSNAAALQRLRKQWGTTLSMAMAVISETHVDRLPEMLSMLTAPTHQEHGSTSSPPLVLLDGNFLAAVQQQPKQEMRHQLLETARRGGLLDFFKLIRGLASRGRLDEALAVFSEAVMASPPLLSRKEMGSSRVFLLNGAPYNRVEHVSLTMHNAQRRTIPEHRMNDAEVEAVMAKAVNVPVPRTSSEGSIRDKTAAAVVDRYWGFSMRVMEENYGPFMRGEPHARRRPSLSTLSLFLRNPNVTWQIALALTRRLSDGLPRSHAQHLPLRKEEARDHRSYPISHTDTLASAAVPVEVLVLNAAAAVCQAQGRATEAEELSLRAITEYHASPSADFLLTCDSASLRRLLHSTKGVRVDPKVLYHLLHTAQAVAAEASVTGKDGAPKEPPQRHVPRALEVVSLLMSRACPAFPEWLDTLHAPRKRVEASLGTHQSWLPAVPASIHCEALACVRRCVPDAVDRAKLTMAYVDVLTLPLHPLAITEEARQEENRRTALRTSHYNALWEALLTLVDLPSEAFRFVPGTKEFGVLATKRAVLAGLVARATTRCDFLPPAHMLLPNQLDRLLPPPSHVGVVSASRETENSKEGRTPLLADRCHVAQTLVLTCFTLVERRIGKPEGTAPCAPATVEPVVLHGLLKLCCRVGELAETLSAEDKAFLEVARRQHLGPHRDLAHVASRFLDWQATCNGVGTVSPQSLHLLYSLCAASREDPQEEGLHAEMALKATERLLQQARRSQPQQERTVPRSLSQSRAPGPVVPAHYSQFSKLFGWQMGLEVWYRTFPKEVLLAVAHSPAALNRCLSLDEYVDDEDSDTTPPL